MLEGFWLVLRPAKALLPNGNSEIAVKNRDIVEIVYEILTDIRQAFRHLQHGRPLLKRSAQPQHQAEVVGIG